MPLTFENRANAFEARFAHDEEVRFRTLARRDKLFVRWVSTEHKLSASDSDELLDAVMAVRDGPGHDAALLMLVRTKVTSGQGETANKLEAALLSCAVQAQEQILTQLGAR